MKKDDDILSRITNLKRKIEQVRRDKERAVGQREASLKRLREEFDCDNEGDGKKLLARMERDLKAKKQEVTEGLDNYETRWKEQLG